MSLYLHLLHKIFVIITLNEIELDNSQAERPTKFSKFRLILPHPSTIVEVAGYHPRYMKPPLADY